MNVTLEAIEFNHIAGSAASDGFSLRRNETQAMPKSEWRRSVSFKPEDAPAAYSLCAIKNQTLTIQASITCNDPQVKSFWIRAVDGNLYPKRSGLNSIRRFILAILRPFLSRVLETNVLGSVARKEVKPCSGPEDFRTFELADVRLEEVGIGVSDIVWRWQFSLNGAAWKDIVTTSHRIYTVLELPKGSWKPHSTDQSDTEVPWTEVLEYACRWASGAHSLSEVAKKITIAVNALGPAYVQYDQNGGGSSHYTKPRPLRFECGKFLKLLGRTSMEPDPYVNCDDCAAIVSSFANILGCSLPQSTMESPSKPEFRIRRHQKIGRGWKDFHFFNYHAAAWLGGVGDEVSDASLKLDASIKDSEKPLPLVAGNMPFGRMGESEYRFRLVGRDQESECEPREGSSFYWPIDVRRAVSPAEPFLHRFIRDIEIHGWTLTSIEVEPFANVEAYWARDEGENRSVLRIDAYATVPPDKTDDLSSALLERFELPVMKPQPDTGFADKVYASDTGFVVLFTKANLVFLIRNVGPKLVKLWDVARLLDENLKAGMN